MQIKVPLEWAIGQAIIAKKKLNERRRKEDEEYVAKYKNSKFYKVLSFFIGDYDVPTNLAIYPSIIGWGVLYDLDTLISMEGSEVKELWIDENLYNTLRMDVKI